MTRPQDPGAPAPGRPGAPVRAVLALAFCLLGAAGAAAGQSDDRVMVFAAASTTGAMLEVADRFAAAGLGRVTASFASSSTLARQIENGAPADVFISANEQWMDYLAERGRIDVASRVDFLGNGLVLVAPRDGPLDLAIAPGFPLAAALGDGRLALADPDHVPAGMYAKAALVSLGVWESVRSRLAPMANVRAALVLVERGEVAAGIVYATDAAASAEVVVVGAFPPATHPPVTYPLALVTGSAAARRFRDFLGRAEARAVFAKYGFTLD